MFKKTLLGTAIAVVFSTACYAQTPASPPAIYQDWFNDALTTYNQAMKEPCLNRAVFAAMHQLEEDQHSMVGWIDLANQVLAPPVGESDIRPSQARLDSISAALPAAKNENTQVGQMIFELGRKPFCQEDKPRALTPQTSSVVVPLTPQEADGVLRVLLGVPVPGHEHDHDRTVDRRDDSRIDQKVDQRTDSKIDQKVEPKSDARVDQRIEQKTDAEHSQRIEKADAEKQVARTNTAERVSERNVEARQSISRVTPNAAAHVNAVRSFGSIHTSGFAPMRMGNMGGMHVASLGGLGGMRMGGMGGGMGGFGGMRMGGFGGMHR